jgi:diadenosine tetraphosphate (Ap4A) HIT family hydrolase
VPALRGTLVGYVRSRGGSWIDVSALTGLSEADARGRWQDDERPEPPDPDAAAAALDEWYTRSAQLEPLARIRDPFTRLLHGRAAGGDVCLICAKYDGEPVPNWAGHAEPPGGHLVDDGTWRVGHGPTAYWPAGTLLIESRRHLLDHADLTPAEAASFGPLVRRLTGPLREATGAPRVHVFSCMEGTEHFHVWLVPRRPGQAANRTFVGDPGYCTAAEAEDVIERVRKVLADA